MSRNAPFRSFYPHDKRFTYRSTYSHLGILSRRHQFSRKILSHLTTFPHHLSKIPLFNSSPQLTWIFFQLSMRQMDVYPKLFYRLYCIAPDSRARSTNIPSPFVRSKSILRSLDWNRESKSSFHPRLTCTNHYTTRPEPSNSHSQIRISSLEELFSNVSGGCYRTHSTRNGLLVKLGRCSRFSDGGVEWMSIFAWLIVDLI